jgi:hypothetical protein
LLAELKQTQWFGIALGLLTIFYAALYCVFLYTTLVRVPVWDLLDWVVFYLQTGRTGDWWSYLWQPHNEHRIPISRLLLAVDIEIFRGSGIPFLIFGALSQLAIVGILIREIRLSSQPTELRLVAIAAVIFAFAASHLAILVSMAVLGVFLQTTLFVILAITFLDGENENRHSVLRRSLAIVCAALAPFSVSAGLLVWPVMLWAAWRGNLGPKWFVLIAIVGIAEWIIYLPGISVTPHKLISAAEIVNMLDYSVRLLGLPWSHAPSLVWFGRLAGLTWFAVGGWLLVTLSLHTPTPERLQRIGAALILFMFSIAAAAGIARLGVAPDREMPIRYSIFVAAGQIGILFAASGYLISFCRHFAGRAVKSLVIFAAIILVAQQVASGFAATAVAQKYISLWELFCSGRWTPEMESYVYPSQARAEFALQLFRKDNLYSVRTLELPARNSE